MFLWWTSTESLTLIDDYRFNGTFRTMTHLLTCTAAVSARQSTMIDARWYRSEFKARSSTIGTRMTVYKYVKNVEIVFSHPHTLLTQVQCDHKAFRESISCATKLKPYWPLIESIHVMYRAMIQITTARIQQKSKYMPLHDYFYIRLRSTN